MTINSAANPAPRGGVIVLFATGAGVVDPPLLTGQPAPVSPLSRAKNPIVLIGGQALAPDFAGMTPGFAGLLQVNARIPAQAPTGAAVPLRIGINGVLLVAVALVYLLIVVNFQSWLDPFIIITALPGALAGIAGEVWFRGLLLARIVPILGESRGNIYQAAVFGAFETVIFYMITGQAAYIPVIFIIGAFTGFYWGRATLKADSLAAPIFLHAGLYILLLLPILTGLSP